MNQTKPRLRPMPRPLLKWAGGKGSLLPELLPRVEAARPFHRYFEPFFGGGALFFELARLNRLPAEIFLSDANPNLVQTYVGVRDYTDETIALLRDHKSRHCHEYYYEVRNQEPQNTPERAARVIYLNKTCFNGLYRENRNGGFNVPIGRYKNPLICDEQNIRACAQTLKSARLAEESFEYLLETAKSGDFIYLDPPYHPVSQTASFTAYARGRFEEKHQRDLAGVVARLHEKGVKILLSNSMTGLVLELYRDFEIEQVHAARNVNSNPKLRGKIAEALIRNF